MNTRKLIAILIAVGLIGCILLIVVSRPAQPPALPDLLPLPDYLKVFPEPGQTVQLNPSPQVQEDANVISLIKPEDVCGELNLISQLQPGDNFDFAYVKQQTSLVIDGKKLGEAYTGTAKDLLMIKPFPNGKATTGGPFLLCWQGPNEPGYHIAMLSFRNLSYTWWYQIKE